MAFHLVDATKLGKYIMDICSLKNMTKSKLKESKTHNTSLMLDRRGKNVKACVPCKISQGKMK